jgi:hypothetical protein
MGGAARRAFDSRHQLLSSILSIVLHPDSVRLRHLGGVNPRHSMERIYDALIASLSGGSLHPQLGFSGGIRLSWHQSLTSANERQDLLLKLPSLHDNGGPASD